MSFVANLKAGDDFASYLFKDILFPVDPNSGSGSFAIAWKMEQSGQTPAISNFSLFAKVVDTPSVPEPATLGMLGLGLLGMAAIRRRKLGLKS